MSLKIALNGFGRIGRSIARVIFQTPDVELVGINDISPWENLAYLLQYDSIHRKLPLQISYEQGYLKVDSQSIKVFNHSALEEVDFSSVGADVVIEASGRFLKASEVSHHLKNGVKKVIFSAPALDETPAFVLGVNHLSYNGEAILSNASCTTNALAPICKIIDKHYGINGAFLSTIHSYTNDQKLLDSAHHSDKRRSRCAGLNIIPTSTGSAKALHRVLPNLKDKIHGHSLRVPVADVSMIDLSLHLQKKVQISELNMLFAEYAKGEMRGILEIDQDFRVSSDLIGNPHSVIIAEDLSFEILGEYLKVMAWYDNEWGYANRIVEMAKWICE